MIALDTSDAWTFFFALVFVLAAWGQDIRGKVFRSIEARRSRWRDEARKG